MFKLIVLAIHDKKSGMRDKVFELNLEAETQEDAELRALLWLNYCPNDIVMLLDPETLFMMQLEAL